MMKNNKLNWTSLIAAFTLFTFISACNNTGKEEGAEMEGMEKMEEGAMTEANTEGMPAVLVEYINIKNALVKDNYEQARQEAADFQNALGTSDQLTEAQKADLKQSAGKLAQAKDIEALREQFSDLSRKLYQVVQANDLTDKTLYWQHCPMAMKGQGANWLSLEEKVQNPFMGQKMPGCGSVQETL